MQKKKTFLFIAAVAIAAGIAAALIYYANFNPLNSKSLIANETGGDNSISKLNLTSVKAYDVNHSLIGEIEPNQSFKTNHPVLIQTEFSNPDSNSGEYIVASEIRRDSETESLTTVQADVAGSGSVSVETYWKPEQAGDYSLLIFAYKPEELDRGPVIAPVEMIEL
ncbi:MAG: hypothetical protein ACREAY_00690 [Nitrososphaera sp.]|uniref:hypothetical protein n=1 Tax=Nitrososphaera sp. TaxID=1971748 RepID=UPI003D6DD0CF